MVGTHLNDLIDAVASHRPIFLPHLTQDEIKFQVNLFNSHFFVVFSPSDNKKTKQPVTIASIFFCIFLLPIINYNYQLT